MKYITSNFACFHMCRDGEVSFSYLAIVSPLYFYINLRICLSVSAEKAAGVLVGIILYLYQFRKMVIQSIIIDSVSPFL